MQLTINHKTHYTYDLPVHYALQQIRLRPLTTPQQTVLDWSISVVGGKIENTYLDHLGNSTDLISVDADATQVVITATGHVETHDNLGILGHIHGNAPLWFYRSQTPLTAPSAAIRKLAKSGFTGDTPLISLHGLSAAVLGALPYGFGETHAVTSANDALTGSFGVCQDHAHIFIAAARSLGFAARYVSGYLMINDRIDQDAGHAWAEVFLDDLGWVGFDVSNGISPDERYVRTAVGLDANDAAPVKGMRLGNANESLIVSLQVQQ